MQDNKTQFGFTKVADGEKQPLVSEVFSSVASKYDLMNDAMSLGLHRLWKRAMIDQMALKPGQILLDVASGTGDIAKAAQTRQPDLKILATDINPDMLRNGRDQLFNKYGISTPLAEQESPIPLTGKSSTISPPLAEEISIISPPLAGGIKGGLSPHPRSPTSPPPAPPASGVGDDELTASGGNISGVPPASGREISEVSPPNSGGILGVIPTNATQETLLHYAVADGSALPIASNSVHRVSIAFGIRNIPDIEAALAEFYRALKPGGKFVCMEFSKPSVTWLEKLYDAYSFNVIPWLGEKIGHDRAAYQYLVESIRIFPTQDQFASLIRTAGFTRVNYTNLSGGIVAIHSGYKL